MSSPEYTVVEQHFKDAADRNHQASLEAHERIGKLTAETNILQRDKAFYKQRADQAFQSLQDAKWEAYKLADAIGYAVPSDHELSEKADALADFIEKQIDAFLEIKRGSLT